LTQPPFLLQKDRISAGSPPIFLQPVSPLPTFLIHIVTLSSSTYLLVFRPFFPPQPLRRRPNSVFVSPFESRTPLFSSRPLLFLTLSSSPLPYWTAFLSLVSVVWVVSCTLSWLLPFLSFSTAGVVDPSLSCRRRFPLPALSDLPRSHGSQRTENTRCLPTFLF